MVTCTVAQCIGCVYAHSAERVEFDQGAVWVWCHRDSWQCRHTDLQNEAGTPEVVVRRVVIFTAFFNRECCLSVASTENLWTVTSMMCPAAVSLKFKSTPRDLSLSASDPNQHTSSPSKELQPSFSSLQMGQDHLTGNGSPTFDPILSRSGCMPIAGKEMLADEHPK